MSEQVISAECATVIGGDVVIKGEVSVEKGLRIDGRIEGSVNTKGKVVVGKSGELAAEVHAGMIIIEGKVKGNITALERVQIEPSGQVIGDLTAPKLTMSEGSSFEGKLHVGTKAANAEKSDDVPPAVVSRLAGKLALSGSGNGNGRGESN